MRLSIDGGWLTVIDQWWTVIRVLPGPISRTSE